MGHGVWPAPHRAVGHCGLGVGRGENRCAARRERPAAEKRRGSGLAEREGESPAGMDSFSLPSASASLSPEQVMEKLKAHFAQAYAQELLDTVGNKCFAKCVTKPGTSLSRS